MPESSSSEKQPAAYRQIRPKPTLSFHILKPAKVAPKFRVLKPRPSPSVPLPFRPSSAFQPYQGPNLSPLLPDSSSRPRPIRPAPPSHRHLRVPPKQSLKRRRRGYGASSKNNTTFRSIKPKDDHTYTARSPSQADPTAAGVALALRAAQQIPGALLEPSANNDDGLIPTNTAEGSQRLSPTSVASQLTNESLDDNRIHRPQPIKPKTTYPPIALATTSSNSGSTPDVAQNKPNSVPPASTTTPAIRPKLMPATTAHSQPPPPALRPLVFIPTPGGEAQLYQLISVPSFPGASSIQSTPRLPVTRSIINKTVVIPKRRTRRCQNCNKLGCRGSQRRHLCTEK
ncbi:hypothetical protein K450DRAFT_221679, partial [Umbelopsis ramanniana AG]